VKRPPQPARQGARLNLTRSILSRYLYPSNPDAAEFHESIETLY
jgi:hypothetical protein